MQDMDYSHGPSISFTDFLISALTALVFGGVTWGAGYGLVAALNFAGAYFQIGPPPNELLASAIQIGYVAGPILAGLIVAIVTYRWVSRLQ